MPIRLNGKPLEAQPGERLIDVLARTDIPIRAVTVLINGRAADFAELGAYQITGAEDELVEIYTAPVGRAVAFEGVLDAVGGTPLIRLRRLSPPSAATIWAKLESCNPAGSVKDRIGWAMLDAAERAGKISPGRSLIVEPTSGNTGIGLAMAAAARGYELIVTMPETMTPERRALLELFGAQIVLTPGDEGMAGAVRRAQEIAASEPDAFIPQQFENPANPEIHYKTTGPEIYAALDGQISALVCGVGTGGTLTGTGRFLRERIPDVLVVAVEPARSAVLSGGKPGPHSIQGIGAGFVPEILDTGLIDEIVTVEDGDAIEMAKRLAREEGISAGISAGAAVCAAIQVAKRLPQSANVVTVLPDDATKYVSVFLGQR